MSTIKSSDEHLTLNADGTSKDIKFQANGVEKASIDSSGNLTVSGNLTSTGIDDNATSTAITIDASENVGIGVVPESWKSGFTALDIDSICLYDESSIAGGMPQNAYKSTSLGNWAYKNTNEASWYEQYNGKHIFSVAPSGSADAAISWTTAMTIDNDGNLLLGTATSRGKAHILFNTNTAATPTLFLANDGSTGVFASFGNSSGSIVGTIARTGSSTSYNTSSDYRLKENVVDMENATDRVKQLKPKRFNFIADDSVTVDGFIAHEVSDIVPEAISGEKDAMMDEEYEVTPAVKDEDGNIVTEAVMGTRSVPDYQGIDQSKLVPLLVKTIQELEARITALEA